METVSGFETRKYISESKRMRRTEFRAPELNCFVIKSVNEREGQVTAEEATVVLGAPDARLFAVPDNFTEAKPSEMQSARWRLDHPNAPVPTVLLPTSERNDSTYLKAQGRR